MKGIDQYRFETYRGLESFQDDENSRKLYFGRDVEKQALFDLVVAEPLAVLFSRSGLGKSSLINAGLKQLLRERGYFPVSARVTLFGTPVESVIFAIRIEAMRTGVAIRGGEDSSSLWQFLNTARFEREDGSCKLVLILDQFEELFTRVRDADPKNEQAFIEDLANVVRRRVPAEIQEARAEELEKIGDAIEAAEGDPKKLEALNAERQELVRLLYDTPLPDVKVLIALREDYLADLERLRESIPAVFHKMMRLDPLTPENARQAIEGPAALADIPGKDVFHFEKDPEKDIDTVDQILQFLETRKVERRTLDSATIDPGQLQLICQRVDAKRKGNLITAKELGGEKGMQRILQGFYRDTLRSIPKLRIGRSAQGWRPSRTNFILMNRPRAAARYLCEHGLIRGGHRDSLMRDAIHGRFGVIDGDLKALEGAKLIRSTTRLERDFFELSHDTLIKPVQALASARRGAYFVAAYLLVCTIPFIAHYFADWKEERADRKLAAMVRSGHVDFHGANLSKRTLSHVTWTRGSLARASLRGATFDKVQFATVDFRGADVSHAKFDGCTFYRCNMMVDGVAPSFAGANIFWSDLTAATIPEADFSHAVLANTKLNNAALGDAKMIGTVFDRTDVSGISFQSADFTGCAWWLASGWSASQERDLSTRFPPEAIVATKAYKDAMTDFESRLAAADRTNKLDVYADRAWYRAIRGAELNLAVQDTQRCLDVHPADPNVLDTRGYVRLQMGDVAGALADCRKASESEKSTASAGEDFYHLALAELAAGDTAGAAVHFQRSADLHYKPTYELVLTPRDKPVRKMLR